MSNDYIYAVARIRCKELSLLTRQDLDQLLSCRTFEECVRVLHDKGWEDGEDKTPESMLAAEDEKLWSLIRELTDDLTPFGVLLLPIDYNNLKAAIKCVVTDTQPSDVFLPGGTIDPEAMIACVKEHDFSVLPPAMAQVAEEAMRSLLQTGDGQLCDILLDRTCLEELLLRGKAGGHELLAQYAETVVAISNIKTAVRACRAKKPRAFLETSIVPCGTLDTDTLITAACKGQEELFACLASTPYSEGVECMKESNSSFEKWCDDRVMQLIQGQKTNPFTVGPLFAYVLAKKSEIGSVRIILSGKLNGLDDSVIRERMRETYV